MPKAKPRKCEPKNYEIQTPEVNWTLKGVKEFIDTLMDLTICKDVSELKNHKIPLCIWKEMEKKLQIRHTVLEMFWKCTLHQQLFYPKTIYMSEIKIKLIEILYLKKIQNQKTLDLTSLVPFFDGCTKKFLSRIYSNLLRNAKNAMKSNDLKVLIQYLYTSYIDLLITSKEDKILPRLKYSNEKLEIIDDFD